VQNRTGQDKTVTTQKASLNTSSMNIKEIKTVLTFTNLMWGYSPASWVMVGEIFLQFLLRNWEA
jgi:hypothetical protein